MRFSNAIDILVKEHHPNCGWGYVGDINNVQDLDGLTIGNNETAKFTYDDVLVKKKELEKQYADNEYQRKRLEKYPSIQECIHAILDDDLTALQAKRKLVKEKYPKPQ